MSPQLRRRRQSVFFKSFIIWKWKGERRTQLLPCYYVFTKELDFVAFKPWEIYVFCSVLSLCEPYKWENDILFQYQITLFHQTKNVTKSSNSSIQYFRIIENIFLSKKLNCLFWMTCQPFQTLNRGHTSWWLSNTPLAVRYALPAHCTSIDNPLTVM